MVQNAVTSRNVFCIFTFCLGVFVASPGFAAADIVAGRDISGVRAPYGRFGLEVGSTSSIADIPILQARGALIFQINRYLELNAGVGGIGVDHQWDVSGTLINASGVVVTPSFFARIWPLERHNPILEFGGSAVIASLNAHTSNNPDGSVTYERKGVMPGLFAGAGYGFRTFAGFRLVATAGWTQMLGTLDPSSFVTTGRASEVIPTSTRAQLDRGTSDLFQSGPYASASASWMF